MGGRNRRPNFVIFVVWYTLIVGGLVMVGVLVAWSKKYCLGPAEIHGFIQECGTQGKSKIYLFVSDVNQGNKTLTSRLFYLKCERHFK